MEKGAVRSHMLLDLRPDRTFTLTNSITGGPGPEGDVTNASEGHWRVERGDLFLSLERSADGRPIPAERKQARFMVFQDDEGDRAGQVRKLVMTPHGPEFARRTAAATQP